MTYQVIARKWRPQTFEEVTGQEAITRTLRNAIEHDRLHHAYLFSGARGVGKTTTARLLAKALNCHRAERPTPVPCAVSDENACPSCREIAEGRSMDVLEIDAASNTGVDNVRDAIIDTVGIRPARDRYKVFIIDEVHMLSPAAFNALLKTLEEPPPRVLFIMATTHAHKVPVTILSRSQQFEFRTIATAKIAERLRFIADAERIEVSAEALREIARAGEGSMRDAQSAFDQVISFSDGRIETEDVETALGIASVELRARVMRSVADGAPAEALVVVNDLVMRGHDLRNFCRDLLAYLRDLLIVKVAGDAGAVGVDASEQERRSLVEEAAAFSESDLVRFFHSLTETETHLRESAHPRYQLEIGLVKIVEMRRLAPLARIAERLDALEEALSKGVVPGGGSGAASPASPAPGGSSSSGAPRRSSSGSGGGAKGMSSGGGIGMGDGAAADHDDSNSSGAATLPSSMMDASAAAPPPRDATVAADVAAPPAKETTRQFTPPRIPSFAASKTAGTPSAASSSSSAVAAATAPTPTPGLKLVPPPMSNARDSSKATVPVSDNAAAPSPPANDAIAPFPLSTGHALSSPGGYATPPAPTTAPSFFDETPPPSFLDAPVANRNGGDQKTPLSVAAEADGVSPAWGAGTAAGKDDPLARIKSALDDLRKPFLAIALDGARRASVEGDELYVEFAPEGRHLRDTLSKPDNVRLVREACSDALGREVGVRIVVAEAGEGEDAPRTQQDEERLEKQRLREWAEAQPVVQQLLKTFRAEIIDVRRADGEPPLPPPAHK